MVGVRTSRLIPLSIFDQSKNATRRATKKLRNIITELYAAIEIAHSLVKKIQYSFPQADEFTLWFLEVGCEFSSALKKFRLYESEKDELDAVYYDFPQAVAGLQDDLIILEALVISRDKLQTFINLADVKWLKNFVAGFASPSELIQLKNR